jgi:hypothetical protein
MLMHVVLSQINDVGRLTTDHLFLVTMTIFLGGENSLKNFAAILSLLQRGVKMSEIPLTPTLDIVLSIISSYREHCRELMRMISLPFTEENHF